MGYFKNAVIFLLLMVISCFFIFNYQSGQSQKIEDICEKHKQVYYRALNSGLNVFTNAHLCYDSKTHQVYTWSE